MKSIAGVTIAVYLAALGIPGGLGAAEPAPPAVGVFAVQPLAKGAPAPFLGLLVPESRFVELLEAENEVRELRAKLATAKRTGERVEAAYLRRLAAAIPWYDSPTLNRWFGFGLGLLTFGLALWGTSEIKDEMQ